MLQNISVKSNEDRVSADVMLEREEFGRVSPANRDQLHKKRVSFSDGSTNSLPLNGASNMRRIFPSAMSIEPGGVDIFELEFVKVLNKVHATIERYF